jgi:hypothetical protein
MPDVQITRNLPRCVVTKKLVQSLEAQTLEYMKEIYGEGFSQERYSVQTVDNYATVTYKSIAEHKDEMFSNSIKSLQMNYGFTVLNIVFSNDAYSNSSVRIEIENAKSPEHVNVFADHIIRTVKAHEHKAFFYAYDISLCWMIGAFAMVFFLVSIISLQDCYKENNTLGIYYSMYVAIFSLAVLAHCIVCSRIPRCYFDCPAHNRLRANLRHWALFLGGSVITLAILKPLLDLLTR